MGSGVIGECTNARALDAHPISHHAIPACRRCNAEIRILAILLYPSPSLIRHFLASFRQLHRCRSHAPGAIYRLHPCNRTFVHPCARVLAALSFPSTGACIYELSNNDFTTWSAPISGITRSNTSSNTPASAMAAFFTFLARQSSVVTRLEATTQAYSRLLIGTSVGALRILVLIGQQISRPVALLYALLDNTKAGTY